MEMLSLKASCLKLYVMFALFHTFNIQEFSKNDSSNNFEVGVFLNGFLVVVHSIPSSRDLFLDYAPWFEG
jgi:hypothetical protein